MGVISVPDSAGENPPLTRDEIGAEVLFTDEQASLLNGEEIDTGFLDGNIYAGFQITVVSDAEGLTYRQSLKMTDSGTPQIAAFPLPSPTAGLTNTTFSATFRERFLRIQLQNNTGGTVTNTRLEVKGLLTLAQPTSTPLALSPVDQSQALLTQSVALGLDPNGTYRNGSVNQIGAMLVSDFKLEVARGLYEGYSYGVKTGRVPDVDTTTTPEDIYNGGNLYTGFNATANEEISVTSDDPNDVGSLLSSGTVTGGDNNTLTDSSATFITDGVSVGDLVINDTQGTHGIITAVDSETQVTVFGMVNGIAEDHPNNAGESYRIATASDTGAAVIRLSQILDENYVEQTPVYVILNGLTTVTTSGINAMRCPKGRTVLSGSSGRNEGEVTVTQAVSTSNVFCVIPTFGATTIGCFTVPAGVDCVVTHVSASITRTSGSLGSATIALNVREFGQGFNAERVYEINTGAPKDDPTIVGVFPAGTDIKGTVEAVSDNNTVGEIEIEYYFINRNG